MSRFKLNGLIFTEVKMNEAQLEMEKQNRKYQVLTRCKLFLIIIY